MSNSIMTEEEVEKRKEAADHLEWIFQWMMSLEDKDVLTKLSQTFFSWSHLCEDKKKIKKKRKASYYA